MFAILQKYDFSSKSQQALRFLLCCSVVCDTAKVRFFKQITTLRTLCRNLYSCLRYCKSTIFQANHNPLLAVELLYLLFAILQKYDFSSKSQLSKIRLTHSRVVCDTAKVRFFKQITTDYQQFLVPCRLFAILQKYDFSSKSQHLQSKSPVIGCCLRYCKSTIFQANHNHERRAERSEALFAILQKYDFSSKSQPIQ